MGIIMALQYLQVIQEPQFFEALLHGTLLGTITLIASFILLKNFFCLFILFIWLCQVLVVALGSSLQHVRSFVVALGLLCRDSMPSVLKYYIYEALAVVL